MITRMPTYLRFKRRMYTGENRKEIIRVIHEEEMKPLDSNPNLMKFRCIVVYEDDTEEWVPLEKIMKQSLIRGYENWSRTGRINPRDLMEEYQIRQRWTKLHLPVQTLLTLFLEHLEQKTMNEIIKPEKGSRVISCTSTIKMVDQQWLEDRKRYEDEIKTIPGMFDQGYMEWFVDEKDKEGLFAEYYKEGQREQELKRQSHWEEVRKARKEDQPNRWVDIATELNRTSVSCPDQVLMVLGLTGGPCNKCFSIWHASKNHNRRNCKRCGKTGHLSRRCELVRENSSGKEQGVNDMPVLEDANQSC